MPQFKAFVKSAEKARREQIAMMIQASGFAMADGKSIKKTVDGLLNGRD